MREVGGIDAWLGRSSLFFDEELIQDPESQKSRALSILHHIGVHYSLVRSSIFFLSKEVQERFHTLVNLFTHVLSYRLSLLWILWVDEWENIFRDIIICIYHNSVKILVKPSFEFHHHTYWSGRSNLFDRIGRVRNLLGESNFIKLLLQSNRCRVLHLVAMPTAIWFIVEMSWRGHNSFIWWL